MNANLIFVVGTLLIAVGTGLTFVAANKKSNEATKSLKTQLVNLEKGSDKLLTLNQELKSKVEKYQEDLNEKDILIKELEIKSKKAERGISSTYDFNGAKRETTKPGHINLTTGPEIGIFQKLVALEKQKKYHEIIEICENQIKKTPEWLTLYLFLGVAHANTGNKIKAIELFNYVNKNAPDDPDYRRAKELLEVLNK